jgi:helicase
VSQITVLEDQLELVPTKNYPKYAHFPFEYFNPVQSRIFEIFNKDCNVLVAAATSSGKTITAEMIAAYEIQKGGRVIYLAPLKALAKEKIDDWTNEIHHFAKAKQAICTGDYRLTPERKKELEEAQLVMMTTEMLNARVRNFTSEHNEWIKNITLIISDEHHLLSVLGRGDKLEIGLMKFCDINPDARIVGLSATMPNVKEIAEWTEHLNGKETYLIDSQYRPCPLGIHWEVYDDVGNYETVEANKVQAALELVEAYEKDKFIVFVHAKKTGELVKKALLAAGIDCEFHNADLEKDKREKLETKFKKDKNFRVMIATSTVAWGLNMPARRVIIVGVHRGLDEVEQYDIKQMVGRSGRVGLDPRGDAYILVPERKADYHMMRLSRPAKIESRLLDYIGTEENPHYKTLAFHLVSEIHHGEVSTKADIQKWYSRTLASFQANDLEDDILDSTLDLLQKYNAIKLE